MPATDNFRKLADELYELRQTERETGERIAAVRESILATGRAAIEGDRAVAVVSDQVRSSIDLDMAERFLTAHQFRVCTKTTTVKIVRVTLKGR